MKKSALVVLLSCCLAGCGGAPSEPGATAVKDATPTPVVKPYLDGDINKFQVADPILKDIAKAETEAVFVIKQIADAQERYMGMPGKGEYTSNLQSLIEANVLADEQKYDSFQKRGKEKNALILDGGYTVHEELIEASPLKNRYRYVANPPERFKGLDVPSFVISDETRQRMRKEHIPEIEVVSGSYHSEVLDMELNAFFQPKDNSPEERARVTMENLYLLQNAVDNFRKLGGKLPQNNLQDLLYDYRRAEISKPNLLKHFPQELVSVTKSDVLLAAGRQISKELNSTGGWYYNPATGKVQVNWDKPLDKEWGKLAGQKPSEWKPQDNGKTAIFAFVDKGIDSTASRDEKVQTAFYQILDRLKIVEKKNGTLVDSDLDPAIENAFALGQNDLKMLLVKKYDPGFKSLIKTIDKECEKAYDVLKWLMDLRPNRLSEEEITNMVRQEMDKAAPKKEDDLALITEKLMSESTLVRKVQWDSLERVVNQLFDEWKKAHKQ